MVNVAGNDTNGLTPAELALAEDVLRGLWNKVGREKAITATVMVLACKKTRPALSKGLTGPRMRMIIHYLRVTGRLTDLVATEAGYYREPTIEGLERYKDSLVRRAESIMDIVRCIGPVAV